MNPHKVIGHHAPAISNPKAMLKLPDVRSNERDELLAMVEIKTDDYVLDIQSAAGHVPGAKIVPRGLIEFKHYIDPEMMYRLRGLSRSSQWIS
jgi:hypothetical protein